MSSTPMLQPEPQPITACTVSRDVQNFDLLIEDMESCLGESWGDLGFAEALAFFGQPEAEAMEFVALAMDETDEENLVLMTEIITKAKARAHISEAPPSFGRAIAQEMDQGRNAGLCNVRIGFKIVAFREIRDDMIMAVANRDKLKR